MPEENFKLWKDEDFPEPQPTAEMTTDAPATPEAVEIPADPAPVAEVPETQPEVAAPSFDIDKEIETRFGRPLSEVQKDLERVQELERLSLPDDEIRELIKSDEFLQNFARAYGRGGKKVAEEYVEALTKDFSKFTAEQLVEHSVQRRMPGAPKSVLEAEFKKELASMGLTEDLEPGTPEHQRYSEYLAWKAGELREKFSKEQESFKIPERQKQEPSAAQPIDQEAITKYEQSLKSSPDTLGLVASKSVSFGDFTLAVEPEELVNQAIDTTAFFKQFSKNDGTPDYKKFYEMAAIAKVGPQRFAEMVAKAAEAKERLKWVKDIKNPSSEPKAAIPAAGFTVRVM